MPFQEVKEFCSFSKPVKYKVSVTGKREGVASKAAADIVNIILELIKEAKISKGKINESFNRIIKMKLKRRKL